MAPRLANEGYCVFTLTTGQLPPGGPFGNLNKMAVSARQLSAFVDSLLDSALDALREGIQ